MSYRTVLESELRTFQIELTSNQELTLAAYCDELDRWNERINLTGLNGQELVRRLVIEPIWIGLRLQAKGVLIDVGSGNGSPAVPLHVVCQFQAVHLIEARAKRAAFLRHLVSKLSLARVGVHRSRLQEIASSLKKADWITLQAVAFTKDVLSSIRCLAHATTNVVWITSPGVAAILTPREAFGVPITGTQVFVFRLDLP